MPRLRAPNNSVPTRTRSILISCELDEKLVALATRDMRSVNGMINVLLEESVASRELAVSRSTRKTG